MESENQFLTNLKVALVCTGTLKIMNLNIIFSVFPKTCFNAYNMSDTARATRSLLKVCFIMSLERRVWMETKLDISPNKPRKEKMTPSHQNSYSFQT